MRIAMAQMAMRDSVAENLNKSIEYIKECMLSGGGKVYGVDDVHMACCNDGVRPVVLKLERIEV